MIAHSEGFKDAYTRLGREIKIQIECYHQVFNLKTENNKL